MQDIVLAVWDGSLALKNLEKEAPNFLVSFNRANPGKYGDLSLDAPLYSEGRMTLGDAIASDAFHF